MTGHQEGLHLYLRCKCCGISVTAVVRMHVFDQHFDQGWSNAPGDCNDARASHTGPDTSVTARTIFVTDNLDPAAAVNQV